MYCDFRDPENFDRIAASILKQLLLLLETIPPALHDRFNRLKSMAKSIQSAELTRLIYDIVAKFSSAYIVIDALDELTTAVATHVITLLLQLQSRGVYVVVLSRRLPLSDLFPSELAREEITANHQDIEAYLQNRIESSPCRDLLVGEFKMKMISQMTDKAAGRCASKRLAI